MNTSCQLDGGLTLHHSLPSASIGCQRAALELVASRVVALVVTWSAGSQQADRGGFAGLERVSSRYRGSPDVVALAYGKGSPCQRMPPPLRPWVREGSALCISGPNMGAREAHSVLHFCSFFYEHLPRAVIFMQDDPHALDLGNGRIQDWALALKTDAVARLAASRWQSGRQHPASAARSLPSSSGLLPPSSSLAAAPWRPTPCPCHVVRETIFTEAQYGGYRPMAFLMRTFFDAFRNRTEFPSTILWPAGAQFAAARLTVRSKPVAFWRALLGLASPAAPLKRDVPRLAKDSDKINSRNAKWANFGRAVVDLGPTRAGLQVADNRAGISGMDFAQVRPLAAPHNPLPLLTAPLQARVSHSKPAQALIAPVNPSACLEATPALPYCPLAAPLQPPTTFAQACERLWFIIFDPALTVSMPPYPQCYTAEALALSPVRCGTGQCPSMPLTRPRSGGCELTDRQGLTQPPQQWRYAGGRNRCMADGCASNNG